MNVIIRLSVGCLGLTTQDPKRIIAFYNLNLKKNFGRALFSTIIMTGIVGIISISSNNTIILFALPFIAFLVFILLMNLPSYRYNRTMSSIEEYADLIYNELATVKIYSNSIIEAIRFIADGNYPVVSEALQKILYQVNLGASPEKEVTQFLRRFPSPILMEGWALFLDQQKITERNMQVNQELAQQISFNRFEEQTAQLETRIMLYLGLALFLIPIYQILSSLVEWNLFSIILGVSLALSILMLEAGLFNHLTLGRLSHNCSEI